MTRLFSYLIIVLSCLSLISANGSSKFQIGNDLSKELIEFLQKKAIIEVNKYKDNIPEFNFTFPVHEHLDIKFTVFNMTFQEIIYREDELEINVDEAAKRINVKLSKVILLIYKII